MSRPPFKYYQMFLVLLVCTFTSLILARLTVYAVYSGPFLLSAGTISLILLVLWFVSGEDMWG